MAIDYGRTEIAAFKQGALSGQLTYTPEAVTEVVRIYDILIENLLQERERILRATQVSGFGGLASAQQLATGFSNKASEMADILTQFIEGAMRLQEAYLIAGGRLENADLKNSQAIQFLTQSQLEGTPT